MDEFPPLSKKENQKEPPSHHQISEGTTRKKCHTYSQKRPKIVNTNQERGRTVGKDLFPTQTFLFSLGEDCELEVKWLEEESNIQKLS